MATLYARVAKVRTCLNNHEYPKLPLEHLMKPTDAREMRIIWVKAAFKILDDIVQLSYKDMSAADAKLCDVVKNMGIIL